MGLDLSPPAYLQRSTWVSYMHGGMFPASFIPRQQLGVRSPIVPGYETSESGTPLKGSLGERIEVVCLGDFRDPLSLY